jgi:putative redox protein
VADRIQIQVHQKSRSTSEAAIREHRVLIDRPAARGGEDQGPMGGELFLAAIGGCFMSTLLAAVRARDLNISDLSAEVSGVLSGTPAQFSSVDLLVTTEEADPTELGKLVDIADRGCIMMNTLRDKLQIRVRTTAHAAAVEKLS